jgi:hypothetical protein
MLRKMLHRATQYGKILVMKFTIKKLQCDLYDYLLNDASVKATSVTIESSDKVRAVYKTETPKGEVVVHLSVELGVGRFNVNVDQRTSENGSIEEGALIQQVNTVANYLTEVLRSLDIVGDPTPGLIPLVVDYLTKWATIKFKSLF